MRLEGVELVHVFVFLIVFLFLIVYLDRDVRDRMKEDYPDLSLTPPPPPVKSKVEQIKEFFDLMQMGAITKEEFEAEKEKILKS